MDPKVRFTDRVASYVKARPGYPRELVELLRNECGLTNSSVVGDIGSGTGILSRMLCEIAGTVYGIEPNDAMREAAAEYLSGYSNYVPLKGEAEKTGLPATSLDLITAAQAFHWFHLDDARHEFLRILKPNGWTALIWNDRREHGSKLAEAYEQLLVDYGTDYTEVQSRGKSSVENLERFFGHSQIKRASFPNAQKLDRESFLQRVFSASYMPNEGHPRHQAALEAAWKIFDENQSGGQVVLEYDTNVYYAQMS